MPCPVKRSKVPTRLPGRFARGAYLPRPVLSSYVIVAPLEIARPMFSRRQNPAPARHAALPDDLQRRLNCFLRPQGRLASPPTRGVGSRRLTPRAQRAELKRWGAHIATMGDTSAT